MSENLEVAKKIIKAYWREVANNAQVGYSNMSYTDTLITLSRIDEDLEDHIKAVIKIMKTALKELKDDNNDAKG